MVDSHPLLRGLVGGSCGVGMSKNRKGWAAISIKRFSALTVKACGIQLIPILPRAQYPLRGTLGVADGIGLLTRIFAHKKVAGGEKATSHNQQCDGQNHPCPVRY